MILKRERRIYAGTALLIQHSSLTSANPKVTLTGAGMSAENIYQGAKHVEVFNAIGDALAKKNGSDFVDVDAIIAKVDPPEAPPEAEAPAEEAVAATEAEAPAGETPAA